MYPRASTSTSLACATSFVDHEMNWLPRAMHILRDELKNLDIRSSLTRGTQRRRDRLRHARQPAAGLGRPQEFQTMTRIGVGL
jgi:hypothetical protein